jgi:CO/xanthine dehydrogenase Mo-binding subunit
MAGIGISYIRKEAADKVTGAAKYNDDYTSPELLYAWMITSRYAHGKIKSIDIGAAAGMKGIQSIITGASLNILCGPLLEDRPLLAKDKVRYFGEPVALVIANSEFEAKKAAQSVIIDYEPMAVVNSIEAAVNTAPILVHENLDKYKKAIETVYPKAGTNIANHTKIRKGDMLTGWSESQFIAEGHYKFPQTDHMAMETRSARAEIKPDGTVIIHTSTQAPASVKKVIGRYFNYESGKIVVITTFVGGGFGGKASVQLELLAVLASQAAGGRPVRIANTREQDMISSPVHVGFEAKVKLGANKEGKIVAAEMEYYYDCGAYTDSGPKMSRAGAVSCTGPYDIENVQCDSYCVYTNHPYATAYRGFGHTWFLTAMERTLDKLAANVGINPLDIRIINAIKPGNFTPTQVEVNTNNVGDLSKCLTKLKELINWEEGQRIEIESDKVRAKGVACLWKNSSSPTNAISSVILSFNSDGTINLNCGAVEFGNCSKTIVAQILAEKMQMEVNQIHVVMEVNTNTSPIHWKTVASMTTHMVGNAVLDAADDLINQLCNIAAIVLRCSPKELIVANCRVFSKINPNIFIEFKDIVHGYEYSNGNSIGGQIIGKGNFIMEHLTPLDKETGKGNPGPEWTVGAQAVEIEFDKNEYTYRLVRVASVIDIGKVINYNYARGIVMGGMCMGLGQ